MFATVKTGPKLLTLEQQGAKYKQRGEDRLDASACVTPLNITQGNRQEELEYKTRLMSRHAAAAAASKGRRDAAGHEGSLQGAVPHVQLLL